MRILNNSMRHSFLIRNQAVHHVNSKLLEVNDTFRLLITQEQF